MMKGRAMRRVLRRLDRIRSSKSLTQGESDKEDAPLHAAPSTPLLAKRSRQQSSSSENSAPAFTPVLAKRTRQKLIDSGDCESPLTDVKNILCSPNRKPLGCVGFGKRRKRMVTLLVGKERQVFKVEPQMLEHRLLECLLARTSSAEASAAMWEDKENAKGNAKGNAKEDSKENAKENVDVKEPVNQNGKENVKEPAKQNGKENVKENLRLKKGYAAEIPIRLDCDAILFEHILWLLNNDDPAIRQLNIEELMEFYE